MRTTCCFLFFMVFIAQSTQQLINNSLLKLGEEPKLPLKKSVLRLFRNNPLFLDEVRSLPKQAINSTSNSSLITATRQGPCQCGGGICGCCSRILYDTWKQKACVNVTYDPDEFSFTAKILMNDRVLYTRTVSGKNPPPVCVPIPRIPFIKACARFYNIYFQGRNIHVCINMEGKFRETTLFKVGLDCVRFGAKGLALVKPEEGGGLGQIQLFPGDDNDNDDDDDDDDDDYDDYDGDDYDDDDDDILDF